MLKSIKKKLNSDMGRDVIWTFTLQILIMVCSFVINKLLASRLSIEDFGQYNVIKRSIQVLSFVMLAGVGITLPRYIPIYRNSTPPRKIAPLLTASLIYIIGISLIVILISILFSPTMQNIVIGEGNNQALLFIALSYAFILAIAQYTFAFYRGIGNFKWYNGTQLAMQLSIIIPLLLLPVLTIDKVFISWLIISIVIVAYLLSRELWSFISKGGSFKSETPLTLHLNTIIKYSSGRLIADFFQYALAAFPLIYISNTHGLQPTAYFSVGITFVTMITPFFSFMGIILLPYVSKAIARHEMTTANRIIQHLSLLYMGAATVIIIVLYLFTGYITTLLFASDYLVTTEITRIMILAIFPQAAYMLYRNVIDAISIIPYNSFILGICLVTMIISFNISTTLNHFAWSYLTISILQGLLSWLTWMYFKKKL